MSEPNRDGDGPDDGQGAPDVDPTAIGPASPDDVARQVGEDAIAGTVELDDGTELPVALDGGIVEAAEREGVDLDRLKDAAVPDDVTFAWSSSTEARANDTSATVPVQSERFGDFGRLRRDSDSGFIQDEQIQRLRQNSINYTQRVGRWLLRQDDLVPSVKERLKALIVGEDGLAVEPKDPESESDQRLAEHLQEVYGDDVRPNQVIDAILRENLMNARAVLRSTDLAELDLTTLQYVKDGITGEEIYIQRNTSVHTFDVTEPEDGSDSPGIDVRRQQIDEQPLLIGDQVFDISLYDTPPLEAVADTSVNKMVLQRLKARKAEITSFGAVYASVEAPSYLPEEQYFDRVQDDDFDGDTPPTKLERALKSNLQKAFDTLKDFQSGTVMSVPDYWTLEQLQIPETTESLDDQIRGYNKDISRRMLVPLDLIELREGAELSRDTLFRTLMTTIAGWRREITRVFDQFARVQADIHGVNGRVEHQFPPLHDQDEETILQALQFAGVAGLTQKEVRQMLNAIKGIDLQTDEPAMSDDFDALPPEGGPEDPDERGEMMAQFMDEQRRGTSPPGDNIDQQGGQDLSAQADDPFEATVFRVVAPDDEADRYDDPVLGIGIDFPNSDVYVDWRNSVFPDELDDPHVSVYGSISDLEQATGNIVEPMDTVSVEAAKALVDGPDPTELLEANIPVEDWDHDAVVDFWDGVGGSMSDCIDRMEQEVGEDQAPRICQIAKQRVEGEDAAGDVVFGNVGGDPFGDQDTLEAFVDALFDAGADDVRLGGESWPDVSGIHDRPVVAIGLSVEDARDVWGAFEDDAAALMGPTDQAQAQRAEAAHNLNGFDSVREAAHHVRRVVERRHQDRGKTVEVESRGDGTFGVLIRDSDGGFRGSVILKESDTDPDTVIVVGTSGILNDLKLSNPRAR